MIEDALLVWKLKCGDADALTRVYLTYKDRLLALAVSLSGDRATAEDALHDVFVNLASSAHSMRIQTNLRAYLSTCVANRIRNVQRRANRQVDAEGLSEEPDEKTRCPDQAAIFADDTARVGRALRELPDDQCEVIVLHLQGGLTFKAIAEALGVSINTVQSRYRYGVEKLRTLLKGELTDEKCASNRKNGQGLLLSD